MECNNLRIDRKKSHAVVIRCSNETWTEVLSVLRTVPDCYVVFSKTSTLKLVIKEEGW
jgi:hypothetical protein